jgi:hypothetical protein
VDFAVNKAWLYIVCDFVLRHVCLIPVFATLSLFMKRRKEFPWCLSVKSEGGPSIESEDKSENTVGSFSEVDINVNTDSSNVSV